MGSTALEQEALGRFVASGGFARHLRRVRPIYRRRREAAIRMITQLLPNASWRGAAAGLHVYVDLGEPIDVQALGVAMYERGVVIEDAARHWADPSGAGASLVVGYGGHPEPALRRALRLLARTAAEIRDAPRAR